MKTLGRILIILTVFSLVMGIMYTAVNASTSGNSTNAPTFERGDDNFARPDGERPEFRGEREGSGWMFGAIKNIAIVAIIVTLVVLPKGWMQKRRKVQEIRTA